MGRSFSARWQSRKACNGATLGPHTAEATSLVSKGGLKKRATLPIEEPSVLAVYWLGEEKVAAAREGKWA